MAVYKAEGFPTKSKQLAVSEIDPAPAKDVRAQASPEVIADYAEHLDELPPLLVVKDGDGKNWLAEGRHRLDAFVAKGVEAVPCRVKAGTFLDAFEVACHANDDHGLRSTNADKQHRVKRALAQPETCKWSQGKIAELCGVSQRFVSGLDDRKAKAAQAAAEHAASQNGAGSAGPAPPPAPAPLKTLGKDGRERSSPPPRPKAAPAPPPAVEPSVIHPIIEAIEVECKLCGAQPGQDCKKKKGFGLVDGFHEIRNVHAKHKARGGQFPPPRAETNGGPVTTLARPGVKDDDDNNPERYTPPAVDVDAPFDPEIAFRQVETILNARIAGWPAAHWMTFVVKLDDYVIDLRSQVSKAAPAKITVPASEGGAGRDESGSTPAPVAPETGAGV